MEVRGQRHNPAALLPVSTEYKAGKAPQPVLTCLQKRNLSRPSRLQ